MIYGWLYRNLMKLAHRYDWHHAPMFGPMEDGATQRWCQWCGFRETYRFDPNFKPLTRDDRTDCANEVTR